MNELIRLLARLLGIVFATRYVQDTCLPMSFARNFRPRNQELFLDTCWADLDEHKSWLHAKDLSYYLLEDENSESIGVHFRFGCIVSAAYADHTLPLPGKYITMRQYLEYPASCGKTLIQTANPYVEPDFDTGFMNLKADFTPSEPFRRVGLVGTTWADGYPHTALSDMSSYYIEAIRIEPGGTELNETDCYILQSVMLLEILSSLVTYNSNDGIISLSHLTVLEYLIKWNGDTPPLLHRPWFEAHEESELRHFIAEEHPFYEYTTVNWAEYVQFIDLSQPAVVEALLRFIQMPKAAIWFADQIGSVHNLGGFYTTIGPPHPLRTILWHGIDASFTERIASIKLPADTMQCCLFASIHTVHLSTVERLLDLGLADVNRKHICGHCFYYLSSTSFLELTPLAFAFEEGNPTAARILLQRGATPGDIMADGSTALHSATRSGLLSESVQMLLENPGVDVHACDWAEQTAYTIAAQLDAKEILQCLVDHGASEVPDVEVLPELSEDQIIQVGLCLARMLRGQVKLVPVILNLAEYWMVNSPDDPYISLAISGGGKEPLRRLVFTTISHDRGWSSHKEHIGTYRMSCSWFEVGKENGRRHSLLSNLHGSGKKRVHRKVWSRHAALPAIADWMGMFRSGDMLDIYAMTRYPGWENHVYGVKVVAYVACL
ncbi:hypothetical protein K438DRAFT_2021987 [Mycena galopus ATCC 62051]|nr:hypothetical protein K438DRAFT_2021987 [Mycena galopus ATCC 62051]